MKVMKPFSLESCLRTEMKKEILCYQSCGLLHLNNDLEVGGRRQVMGLPD